MMHLIMVFKTLMLFGLKNACFWQKGANIYYTFGYITSLDDLKRNSSFINVNKNNITYYIGEWLLGAAKCDVFVEVEFIEKKLALKSRHFLKCQHAKIY